MSDPITQTKQCTKCKEIYPCTLEFFPSNKRLHSGFDSWCQSCHRKARNKWAKENPEKQRERSRKWAENNPKRRKELAHQWYRNHPEKYREWSHRWYANNTEKHNAKSREWKKKNKEKVNINVQKRNAIKQKLLATLTAHEWEMILFNYENRCAYCNRSEQEIGHKLNQEHVVPVCQGGGYTKDNIVPACRQCNSKKRGRTPEQAGMVLHKPILLDG